MTICPEASTVREAPIAARLPDAPIAAILPPATPISTRSSPVGRTASPPETTMSSISSPPVRGALSGDAVALDRGFVEFEAEAGGRRHQELAVVLLRDFLEQRR